MDQGRGERAGCDQAGDQANMVAEFGRASAQAPCSQVQWCDALTVSRVGILWVELLDQVDEQTAVAFLGCQMEQCLTLEIPQVTTPFERCSSRVLAV